MRFNFSDVIMHGTNIRNADLTSAKFDDVNLSYASFTNADLTDTVFREVNMSNVVIEDACIDGLTIWGHNIKELILQAQRRASEAN